MPALDARGYKQGAPAPGKWRSLAGSTASFQGGGLKAAPPLDPPRPSIFFSLFHPQSPRERERRRSWFGCSMVLAYGQVFTLEASEARAPHTPQI